MSLWHETVQIDGSKIDANITDAIPQGGAILTRTMEGAESLELTVSDPDMRFLRSGALTRRGKPSTRQQELKLAAWERFAAMRMSLDGVFFRFAGWQGNYDEQPWSSVLTFEAEMAALMRVRDEPFKVSRGTSSRLQFIDDLAHRSQIKDLSDRGILTFKTFSPDPKHKDDVAKVKDADRKKGISPSAHLTIKGRPVSAEQRRHLETSLTVAEEEGASERVFLAMLCAGIGESEFTAVPNAGGSDYGGVFQGKYKGANPQFDIGDTKGMATSFLKGGKGFQGGGAIKLAASNPDMTPGAIALKVEGSRANFSSDAAAEGFYQQHVREAAAILDAWGGASKTITTRESYEFRAGEKDPSTGRRENYWDASGRLVDERRWRRFATRNALWLGPDEWFFKNRPQFVIDGDENLASQGVLGFTGDADVGLPTAELRLRVIAPRWTAGPGVVFQWRHMGPLDGRWLIWENRLDLTQSVEVAEITLRRPAPEKKDPAPAVRTRTLGHAENPGDLAYPVLNRRGTLIGTPYVGTHAPGQNWQSSNAIDIGVPVGSTLVAVNDGVVSPPGTPYSGFGDTGGSGRFAGKRLHLKTADNAWFYAHMSEISVKAGDEVKKGDILGKSGSANGVAHLHIAIERGDPKRLLGW